MVYLAYWGREMNESAKVISSKFFAVLCLIPLKPCHISLIAIHHCFMKAFLVKIETAAKLR
jgi:hypothetical protein